jgi:hypothetical protein
MNTKDFDKYPFSINTEIYIPSLGWLKVESVDFVNREIKVVSRKLSVPCGAIRDITQVVRNKNIEASIMALAQCLDNEDLIREILYNNK